MSLIPPSPQKVYILDEYMKYTLLRRKGSEEQPSGRICSATQHLMGLFSLNHDSLT